MSTGINAEPALSGTRLSARGLKRARELRPRVDLELRVGVGEVRLDGAWGEPFGEKFVVAATMRGSGSTPRVASMRKTITAVLAAAAAITVATIAHAGDPTEPNDPTPFGPLAGGTTYRAELPVSGDRDSFILAGRVGREIVISASLNANCPGPPDFSFAHDVRVFFDDAPSKAFGHESGDLTCENRSIELRSSLRNEEIDSLSFASGTGSCEQDPRPVCSEVMSYEFRITPADAIIKPSKVPPGTEIVKGPLDLTSDRTPTFRFRSTEPGGKFKCSLDGSRFERCRSPKTYGGKAKLERGGPYRFKVKAIDRDGNADPTPASWKFVILHPGDFPPGVPHAR